MFVCRIVNPLSTVWKLTVYSATSKENKIKNVNFNKPSFSLDFWLAAGLESLSLFQAHAVLNSVIDNSITSQ